MNDLASLWADPSIKIVLRSTRTSPYGRKVRIAVALLGMDSRIMRRDANTLDPEDDLRKQNPLGKMPCLWIGKEPFFDSTVILHMLDAIAGGGYLLPAESAGLERYRALRQARLADGITDAALLMVYEARFRNPEQLSQRWLNHQRGKVLRGLATFEAALPDPRFPDVVAISLACALGYLDWRKPLEWRQSYPGLVGWLNSFAAATPAFVATESDRP